MLALVGVLFTARPVVWPHALEGTLPPHWPLSSVFWAPDRPGDSASLALGL